MSLLSVSLFCKYWLILIICNRHCQICHYSQCHCSVRISSLWLSVIDAIKYVTTICVAILCQFFYLCQCTPSNRTQAYMLLSLMVDILFYRDKVQAARNREKKQNKKNAVENYTYGGLYVSVHCGVSNRRQPLNVSLPSVCQFF